MKKFYGMTVEEVMTMVAGAWMDEDGDVIVPTEDDAGCALYVDDTTGKVFGHCFCGW